MTVIHRELMTMRIAAVRSGCELRLTRYHGWRWTLDGLERSHQVHVCPSNL